MDLDIEFGDVEQAQPERELRPDQNKHYSIASVYAPTEGDLPIFVDIDVMRDMELHALSDTRVELGGVMLGGQYIDDQGNPFVIVHDSLRAEHFEATKGSFKFTHETWEAISRQRDEFPDKVQMVGWYHTHPDWGVFLSGMDMFICDNFFNKMLDLALVIDPCRDDRGWFQWTGRTEDRIRRPGGFYLMASRFRQEEINLLASQLEGDSTMSVNPRYSAIAGQIGSQSAPVVNIAEHRNPAISIALIAMVSIQFFFLVLVSWKLLAPTPEPEEDPLKKQLAAIDSKIDQSLQQRATASKTEAQEELLSTIVKTLSGSPQDFSALYQNQVVENNELKVNLSAFQDAQQLSIIRQQELLSEKTDLQKSLTYNKDRLTKKSQDNRQLAEDLEEAKTQLSQLKKGEGDKWSFLRDWKIVSGMIVAALALLGIGGSIGFNFRVDEEDQEENNNPTSLDEVNFDEPNN